MNVISILLVATESKLHALTQAAARLVCPAAKITLLSQMDEALKRPPANGVELLVLDRPDSSARAKAVQATDQTGLPRWPVIAFGAGSDDEAIEFIPPEDRDERMVARVFRSAVAQYNLRRENARLQGDLMTIGRRISHDLRSPLGGIFAAGEALKEILMEEKPGCTGLMQPIFDSTNDLMRLIDRASFVVKASSNPGPMERTSMGPIVHMALQRLEGRLHAKRATVTQSNSWPDVEGLDDWLEVVWWNLIANAIQYAGEAPRIDLGWRQEDGKVCFWVRDHGPGVPDDRRDQLFQPFHQLHQTNAARGLGLPIVRRLVELQGGSCGYESVPGGGAQFFFTLRDILKNQRT